MTTNAQILILRAVRSQPQRGRWVALATLLLAILGLADPIVAATIVVNTFQSGTGGCSLVEAIYSANFHSAVAIDSTNPDHFVPTGCIPGDGNDTILLPTQAVFQLGTIVDDAHNPFGPTATPIIFSTLTIEANGARLEHVGNLNMRAFAVGTASVDLNPGGTPNVISGTGNLTIRNAHIKGFVVKGGDGASGGGGGMGAGGAIYVDGSGGSESNNLTVENSTFESNGAIGGDGSFQTTQAGGGGGGLSGMGGRGGSDGGGGGGGGGSRGNGGNAGTGLAGADGGGGGGTVTAGIVVEGGFKCGGDGGGDGVDGKDASCQGGGGGGGGAVQSIIIGIKGGDGGNGDYGGGGGGGGFLVLGDFGATGRQGGKGGFGGGGGAGGSTDKGGKGDYGGGGGAGEDTQGAGGTFAGSADPHHGGGGAALGGAIFNHGGSVAIRNSTFTGNFVIRGTSGGGSADNGQDEGGAIFAVDGELSVVNSTISGNQSTGEGAGIVVNGSGTFNLYDTVIANPSARECFYNPGVTAQGAGNLIVNNFGCPGMVSMDDPQLGALQLNVPGDTPTMAISSTSSAFNKADGATSLSTDQRGVSRPQGAGFDIGAYELCVTRLGLPCLGHIIEPPPEFEPLTTLAAPAAGGSVNPPPGIFAFDQDVTLTATPNPGYFFNGWTGPVHEHNNASTFVTMDQPQTVTANFACHCAAEVSGFVTVTRGGYVLNPVTGRYAQTVTVKNNSAHTVTGPISLVLDSLSSNAMLINATGTTDLLELPAARPYLNASVNLTAGQSVAFTLQFTDPTKTAITYNTRVLAGPGSR
jgi:hypothetical protein